MLRSHRPKKFWIILILFFISALVKSQPSVIWVTCEISEINGKYVRASGEDFNGCPCYEGPNGIIYSAGENSPPHSFGFDPNTSDCNNAVIKTLILVAQSEDCDITNPENTFSFGCVVSDLTPKPIPALSSWGLIILGIMLLNISSVCLSEKYSLINDS